MNEPFFQQVIDAIVGFDDLLAWHGQDPAFSRSETAHTERFAYWYRAQYLQCHQPREQALMASLRAMHPPLVRR